MSNLIQDLQNNASNFLYIFIADDAAREVFANAPYILQKRQNQINYIVHIAKLTKYSYEDIRDIIADQINDDYGKPVNQVILDIANGKNVFSLTNISTAVSGVKVGTTIDSKTGYPTNANKDKYIGVVDTVNGKNTGLWEIESGAQVSYYDAASDTYKAGPTPTSDQESRNMWANNINWTSIITMIINAIGKLFGVKSGSNIASYQSDGWLGATVNTTQTASSSWVMGLLALSAVGYMLVAPKDKSSTRKSK